MTDSTEYSKVATLRQLREGFSEEAKSFFDFFFNEDSKQVNDLIGIDFQESKIFFDQENNPIKSQTRAIFPQAAQTFDGRVHGGIIVAALDVAMGVPIGFSALLPENKIMVTRELSKIEILQPVSPNDELIIEVHCIKREERKFWMSGIIRKNEEVLVKAEGFFLSVPMSRQR